MGLVCEGCGVQLLHEQHAALPTPWFAHEGVMSVAAARAGWRDNRCRACQEEHDER